MRVFLSAACLSPHYGGPAFSISRLASALCAAGAEVGLWAPDGSAVTTNLLPDEAPASLSRLSGPLPAVLARFSADLIHDNGLWLPHNHQLAALASRHGLARIVSTRGMLEPWARRHKKMKKDLAWLFYQRRDLVRAKMLHATASAEADNIAPLNLQVPTIVIPNGVDIPELPSSAPAAGGPPRTAIFLGRLYPVKGLPLLIEAWNRVRPQNWRLVLAGPDEAGHRAELEKLIANAGLGGTISFAGPLAGAAKTQALAGAELFILPTHSESFGMAIGEALAHGLPVLTTMAAPWPALGEKACGWRTDVSVSGLAEGLKQATGLDRPALSAMGAAGGRYVAATFGWDAVARQFLAAYASVLAQ